MRERVAPVYNREGAPVHHVNPEPSVAIILPLMDRAADLRLSLRRMLCQEYPHYTVVVIDNSSVDHPDFVLQECLADGTNPFDGASETSAAALSSRPRLLLVERPRAETFNFSVTRNCGVRWSESDLLFFLNGDTIFESSSTLRTIVDDFLHSQEISYDWFIRWRLECGFRPLARAAPSIRSRFRHVFSHTLGSLILIERAVFQQFGGFNELVQDWGYEDTDLIGRLQLAGFGRVEMRGLHDAPHDDSLRVQLFRIKDRGRSWARNRRVCDAIVERFGVTWPSSGVPGDSAWVRINGRLARRDSAPQHHWQFETGRGARETRLPPRPSAGFKKREPPIDCLTLWIGSRLGRVERACLRSFLRHGHAVTLYSYDPVEGVPDGVRLADAASVLPRESIIRHEGGSYALFSNRFRYQLQLTGQGMWIDADLYCLRPIRSTTPYVIGWQGEGLANGAVLRLPPDSPLLGPLLGLFSERSVPPWLLAAAQMDASSRWQADGRIDLSRAPWGVAGPDALTFLVKRHGLESVVQPRAVFYPAPWTRAEWIRDATLSLPMFTTDASVAVHLWNERIKDFKDVPAPKGSFLARIQREGE